MQLLEYRVFGPLLPEKDVKVPRGVIVAVHCTFHLGDVVTVHWIIQPELVLVVHSVPYSWGGGDGTM